jgi:hypothetical protein
MLGIMIFLSCKMFFHWYVFGLNVIYSHFTKIKWNCKINEKWDNTFQKSVLKNYSKIIGEHLHKKKIMNQLHILGLFNFTKIKT